MTGGLLIITGMGSGLVQDDTELQILDKLGSIQKEIVDIHVTLLVALFAIAIIKLLYQITKKP